MSPDWPTLLGQAIDDLSRVAQAEIRLIELHFTAALENVIQDAMAMLIVATALLCAEGCFVAALILLIHQWLQWWIALAIAGAIMVISGVGLRIAIGRHGKRVSRAALENDAEAT
ncbi:MAG TPA: phage holin family protein [Candidatus Binataceae bacterium]|nr:phage holin family protein [Candidatus Binataceae bacterium]